MYGRDVISGAEEEFPKSQLFIDNFCRLAGITILYYDHFITFDEEYQHIWRRAPLSGASILFIINRYFPFLVGFVVLGGNFSHYKSIATCSHYSFWRQVAIIVIEVIVGVVQFLRVFALYGRKKRVAFFVVSVSVVLVGISAWAVSGQSSGISLAEGCQFASSKESAIHIAVGWEALFTFDSLIFILTLTKTYRERLRYDFTGKTNLVNLIVRDGAIYFGIMVIAQGANVLTFYIFPPVLRGTLSTMASAISVSMMSRLMLNLHRTAARDVNVLGTTLGPTDVFTMDGVVEFAANSSVEDSVFDPKTGLRSIQSRVDRGIPGHISVPGGVELATYQSRVVGLGTINEPRWERETIDDV